MHMPRWFLLSFFLLFVIRQLGADWVPWSQRFFLFFLVFIVGAAREQRSGEHESRSGEKEKPLVTLDLNLTFMQTPAVKRVNLIIQKGTNGSLAITCLSAANVSTRVVRSGIFWPTWSGSMCVFARMLSSTTIAKVTCLLNILRSKYLHFSFRHKLLWGDGAPQRLRWNATVLQFAKTSPPETLEYTQPKLLMTRWGYE